MNNQETAEILSKIQKPGANRSPQPVNQPPLQGVIPDKFPANTNVKTSRMDENNGENLNSLKMKRRLKPSESTNPHGGLHANDYQDTNLNVLVPQVKTRPGDVPSLHMGNHGHSGQDIGKLRENYFSGNRQDHENLPNNTFHKLFNNPHSGKHTIQLDSNKQDDFNGGYNKSLPPITYEANNSPQQVVKQKARRIAQASNDRRGMESLPNPNQMRESMDL